MSTLAGLARRAVPYGLATVDLYRILVNFTVDRSSPEYKGPLNTVHHSRDVAETSEVSVVAMNVDTPYSWAWLDLRGGPVLLTMPAHDADRYMAAQIHDLYANIVGYVSPRTSGNAGGTYLVRGPAGGDAPDDVDGVFDCPTDLSLVLMRTQLFGDDDLAEVAALQDQVRLTPLGEPRPLPPTIPTVDVRAPLDVGFLRALDWMLEFMPALPEDTLIREDLSGLGVGITALEPILAEPAAVSEITDGLRLGFADVQARCATVRSSAELFGSREFFAGDHLVRAAGAYLGILGNAAEEFLGVGYRADADGQPFSGTHAYTITFGPDALPPVGAFWSITVYDADGHLHPNRLNRYGLGSRKLAGMVRDADGGVTIHVQHDEPPAALEPNWLPCPPGPFGLTFRTYLPGEAIRDGSWTAPPVRRAAGSVAPTDGPS